MKAITILKKLITIYYYLMLAAFVLGVIILPILLFTNQSSEISFLGTKIDIGALSLYKGLAISALFVILYYFYVKAIYLIKMSLNDLASGNYFSETVINNFKKIGKLFLICGVGEVLAKIIIGLFIDSKIGLEADSSFFLFLIMGLLFMFLSEVFLKARGLQDENELTI